MNIIHVQNNDGERITLRRTKQKSSGHTFYSTWEATLDTTGEVLGNVEWYEDHMYRHLRQGGQIASIERKVDGEWDYTALRALPDGESISTLSKDSGMTSGGLLSDIYKGFL